MDSLTIEKRILALKLAYEMRTQQNPTELTLGLENYIALKISTGSGTDQEITEFADMKVRLVGSYAYYIEVS